MQSIPMQSFLDGLRRMFTLKIDSRLPLDDIKTVYCKELSRKLSQEAWEDAVNYVMANESTLPTPSWFIAFGKTFEEKERQKEILNEPKASIDFTPEEAMQNISRLRKLTQGIGALQYHDS
jgi:glutamate formiminotransferase